MFSVTIQGETLADLTTNLAHVTNQFHVGKQVTTHPDIDFTETVDTHKPSPEINHGPHPDIHEPIIQEQLAEPVPADILQAAAPAGQVELDNRGMPWDKRIHASSKNRVANGNWRNKRGVDDALLAQVEAEIQELSAPVEVAVTPIDCPVTRAPLTNPVTGSPAQPIVAPVAPVEPVKQNTAPGANVYVNQPPIVGQKPAHSFETFKANAMPTVAALMAEGKLNQVYLDSLNKYFGVEQFFQILQNDAQLKELFDTFCSSGLITKVD